MAEKCSSPGAHRILLNVNPIFISLFEEEIIKRSSYDSTMVHQVTIIAVETKEDLQFFDIGGRSPLLDCLYFFSIRFDSAT